MNEYINIDYLLRKTYGITYYPLPIQHRKTDLADRHVMLHFLNSFFTKILNI